MLSVNFPGGEKILGGVPERARNRRRGDLESRGDELAGGAIMPVVDGHGDRYSAFSDLLG